MDGLFTPALTSVDMDSAVERGRIRVRDGRRVAVRRRRVRVVCVLV